MAAASHTTIAVIMLNEFSYAARKADTFWDYLGDPSAHRMSKEEDILLKQSFRIPSRNAVMRSPTPISSHQNQLIAPDPKLRLLMIANTGLIPRDPT